MKKHRLTLQFSLLQGAIWGTYGLVFSYANPFMTEKLGLTDTLAGIVLCIATALSCLLQPLLTTLAEKTRLSPRRVLLCSGTIMALCGVGALLPGLGTLEVTTLFAVICALLQINPAFANALSMEVIRGGEEINFAMTRGVGSICFGIGVRVTPLLIAAMGMNGVPVGAVAVSLLLLVNVFFLPENRMSAATEKKAPAGGLFRENPKFIFLLAGIALLFVGHNIVSNCMFRIAQARLHEGADEGMITSVQGTALMIAALVELPTMFLFHRVAKRIRCDAMVIVSCSFMCIRLALMYVLPGSVGLYVAQCVQMLGFALFTVSTIYYVGETVSRQNVVRGQTCLGTANSVGSLLACALGGSLIDAVGVNRMLLICFGISVLGLLLAVLSLKKTEV